MKKCTKCGYKNDITAQMCNLCGEKLRDTIQGDDPAEPNMIMPKSTTRQLPSAAEKLAGAGRPAAGAPHAAANVATERHYLVPPIGHPVLLSSGKSLSIGRDDDSDLKVASTKASRKHCEVAWRDNVALVRDLGSQNGTWVNDRQLPPKTETTLKDGDTIQAGDLIVTYRRLMPGIPEEALGAPAAPTQQTVRTASLKARQAAAAPSTHDLEGDCSTFAITDVLTTIAERNASGILAVEVEGVKGELVIQEGKVVSAKYPGLDGSIAIQAISALKAGRFHFTAKARDESGKFSTLRAGAAGTTPAQ